MATDPLLPGDLATPATVVFADRMQRNIEKMAAFATRTGIRLRPHAKTHKTAQIADRQLAAGAVGLTVATVGEAEALADACGIHLQDVFIAYPVWAAGDTVERLARLADRVRLRVGTDSAESVARLAALAGRVSVMVEVDCGLRRSGVPPAQAGAVAAAAQRAGLRVDGVFTFPGHSYQPKAAAAAAADEAAALTVAARSLEGVGAASPLRSGGSTPSAMLVEGDVVEEIRPGVYVFNDAQQVELGNAGFDEVALMVAATVVSRSPGRLVLDAGAKVLGPDRSAWASGHGRLPSWPDARVVGLWEHHAVVQPNGPGPALGDVVAVVPNHVCTAVNLVPDLLVVDGGRVTERWPVTARAANR